MIKFTSNGQLPISAGIRVDGKDRLKNVIDHLESPVHAEAARLEEYEELWGTLSEKHPWARIMKKKRIETLQSLVRIAVNVYNDARAETLSA